jgi:hypothetical protein
MAGLLYDPTQPLPLIQKVNNPAWMGVKPTLGQRNNNWGNLRTTDAFLGKTGVNKSYDTYDTPEMGLRALARVLDTYSTTHGIDTIDALVNRYAPASDNTGGSHENYKRFIADQLGISTTDKLDVKGRRAEIMDAIIRFENKNRPLASQDMLQQAIQAADRDRPNNEGNQPMADWMQGYYQDGKAATVPQATPAPVLDANIMREAERMKAAGIPPWQIAAYLQGATSPGTAPAPAPAPAQPALSMAGDPLLDESAQPAPTAPAPTGPTPMVPITTGATAPAPAGGGILTTPAAAATTQAAQPGGYQSQLPPPPKLVSDVSGNRRDSSAMSLSPQTDFNDMLIRMGGRGVAASAKGGLAAFGAITDEYGKIQDANQKSALDLYKAALKGDAKSAKTLQEQQDRINQIDATMFDMNRAKQYLKQGGITGLFDATLGAGWDKLVGNDKEQNARMLLQKLRVDDTLLRIAQTKGAISNKEMDLFLSPSPDLTDQEEVWLRWIEDREQALMRIRSRLAGGQQVDPSQQASVAQVNQFGSSVGGSSQGSAPVSANVAAARAALNAKP